MSLLIPPIAFIIVLVAASGLSALLGRLQFHVKNRAAGTTKPYACGEESPDVMVQPDYSQFFPFAYFFTILHVAALILATVPRGVVEVSTIAVVYVAGIAIGLCVLYRK